MFQSKRAGIQRRGRDNPTPSNPWKTFSIFLLCVLVLLLSLEFRFLYGGYEGDDRGTGLKSSSSTYKSPENDAVAKAFAQKVVQTEVEVEVPANVVQETKDAAAALPDRPSVFGMMVRTRQNVGQALVTVQNVQSLGTNYKFHFFLLLMGDDHVTEEEFFSEEFMRIFRKFNVTPEILPEFPYPSDKVKDTLHYNDWHFALHRLSLYGMHDKFERILLTDSDVVFVAPVDEVFQLTRTGISMLPEPGQCVLPDKMSGGFILIYPEEDDWNSMMDFAKSIKDTRDPYWSNSEQTFLGFYFKADNDQQKDPHNVVSLSHIYTYPLHDCRCRNLDYIQPQRGGWNFTNPLLEQLRVVKVYHFTPGFKPWRYSIDDNAEIVWGEKDLECTKPIVNLYAKHRKAMLDQLTDEEVYSLRMCRTHRDYDCKPTNPSEG